MYPKGQDSESAPGVAPSPSFPAIERDVLAFWKADGTFQASIDQREGAAEWVFYDGPPFANGLPHYGHLLTGYAKDVFPRFQTMRGKQVHRRFGWDTHGLPAELEAERQLGITDKSEIEQMGIARLQRGRPRRRCCATRRSGRSTSPARRAGSTSRTTTRRSTSSFMESRDLGVQDACTTRASPTRATGCCRTAGATRRRCRTTSCAWTTTSTRCGRTRRSRSPSRSRARRPRRSGSPRCARSPGRRRRGRCPTNFALAVGPDIEYAVVPAGPNGTPDATVLREQVGDGASDTEVLGGEYLLAADLVGNYAKDLGYDSVDDAAPPSSRTVARRRARGRHLRPALRLLRRRRGLRACRTPGASSSPTTSPPSDGTGIVHQAPAYGEEDQKVGEAAGIPVDHLARRGRQVPARRDRCRRACSGATRTSRSPSC